MNNPEFVRFPGGVYVDRHSVKAVIQSESTPERCDIYVGESCESSWSIPISAAEAVLILRESKCASS